METKIDLFELSGVEKFLTYNLRTTNPSIKRIRIVEVDTFSSFGLTPTIKLEVTYYNNATSYSLPFVEYENVPAYSRCIRCGRPRRGITSHGMCNECNSDMNDKYV